MGAYVPRIVSPITGEEVAAPATGSMLRQDEENLRRFRAWWIVANKEQLVSFWFICIFSITVFSTLAYSTLKGRQIPGGANLGFILVEKRDVADEPSRILRAVACFHRALGSPVGAGA
jgi:hypothetical protein